MKENILICVDMDGVLTDFDGSFETSNPSHLAPNEYTEKYGRSAFYKYINNLSSDFWSYMTPTRNCKKLLSYLNKLQHKYSDKYDIKCIILTTAFASNLKSVDGKINWIKYNLNISKYTTKYSNISADTQAIIDVSGQKYRYIDILAHIYNITDKSKIILIDDWDKNIIPWNNYGGTGFIYSDNNCKEYCQNLENFIKKL